MRGQISSDLDDPEESIRERSRDARQPRIKSKMEKANDMINEAMIIFTDSLGLKKGFTAASREREKMIAEQRKKNLTFAKTAWGAEEDCGIDVELEKNNFKMVNEGLKLESSNALEYQNFALTFAASSFREMSTELYTILKEVRCIVLGENTKQALRIYAQSLYNNEGGRYRFISMNFSKYFPPKSKNVDFYVTLIEKIAESLRILAI